MRNWIDLITEANKNQIAMLANKVRDSVAPNFSGACEGSKLIPYLNRMTKVCKAEPANPIDEPDITVHYDGIIGFNGSPKIINIEPKKQADTKWHLPWMKSDNPI